MNLNTSNVLTAINTLPDFSSLTPAYFNIKLEKQLNQAIEQQTYIANLKNEVSATWDNTVLPLETVTESLNKTWGLLNHLQSVVDTPELRACVNEWLPKISAFFTHLGQDLNIMTRYESLQESLQALPNTGIDNEHRTVVNNTLRDFTLSGASLFEEQRTIFANNEMRLAQLQQTFSEHVLDATKAFEYHTFNVEDLDGLPKDDLESCANNALQKGKQGYCVTLQLPSYIPVMQYVKNRAVRACLYKAYSTRASELSADLTPQFNNPLDNTPLIEEILKLRSEQAELLSFQHYAQVSLATKMAPSSHHVEQFLLNLSEQAKPTGIKDLNTLKEYAEQHLNIPKADFQAWDMMYASEHLRQAQYAYSEHEVKQYFQEPRVFEGLFKLIKTLFNIELIAENTSVWHDTVRCFRVVNLNNDNTIGFLYIDPYSQEGKQGGAWMNSLISRKRNADNTIQLPVALIVCNAAAPVAHQPALLTHDEVITVFHEFGHALHHLLTQVDSLAISGIAGVEWDAVELPSQFMENYAWEWEVLSTMTAHTETSEPLPRSLFNKMLAAKQFQAGLGMLRQIELSLFDFRLHSLTRTEINDYLYLNNKVEPTNTHLITHVLTQVRQTVSINPPPEFNRMAHSFGHIFSGGYAAGYYSYKWAEVLSADAFSAFKESGQAINADLGLAFKREVLERGGSRPALNNFIAFRGREPQIDALLKDYGLK